MNLASNYVFILSYHASTIAQSFVQEFAQKSLEMLPSKPIRYLEPTLRNYFRAFRRSRFASASFQLLYYYSD